MEPMLSTQDVRKSSKSSDHVRLYLAHLVILHHPETRTVPAAEDVSETFVCTAQGDVSWYINDRWVSPSYEDDLEREGYIFTKTTVTGAPHTTKNLTMTVLAKMSLNGTKIQCRTYGTDGMPVLSNVAWLWIAGEIYFRTILISLLSLIKCLFQLHLSALM